MVPSASDPPTPEAEPAPVAAGPTPEERRRLRRRRLSDLAPAELLALSFLLLIAFGTLGLKLLPGLYTGPPLGWVDALFTATSAVCVTGLIVVDTATYFTVPGQAFLLLLIQLGGLGILTFTTAAILALGRRPSLDQQTLVASMVEVAPQLDWRRLTGKIVVVTLGLEATGALVLWLAMRDAAGETGGLWHAVFQSVSAFCNAGFSTFSDSLIGFRQSPAVLLTVAVLIVVGGIGWVTLEELQLGWRARRHGGRIHLSLHSRLVLVTTGVLLLSAWAGYALFEWQGGLSGLPVVDRLVNALFASVTARTAGFNTIDYATATDASLLLTVILMMIGGSPGSTAGGIKTTTFGLLVIVAWSRLRGRQAASWWGRSVPPATVDRAVGLTVVAFFLVLVGIFALNAGRPPVPHPQAAGQFFALLFEVVSAFNTVGLSMGVTPELSTGGRLLTAVLMFVGRIGPLTIASALSHRRPTERYRYAREDVIVG